MNSIASCGYPDFFIVGAPRSGTTSLWAYLRQHPQIFMPSPKETHFFSQDRVRMDSDRIVGRESDYLRLFESTNERLTGEASASYLWHPDVPQRIKTKSPDAKIIAVLRDPIARAYSNYLLDLADGMRPVPFFDLIVSEYERGEKVIGRGHMYVEVGQYAAQVQRYLDVFGPSRVLLLSFKEFQSSPRNTVTRVAAFLEVAVEPVSSINLSVVHNQTRAPRNSIIQRVLRFHTARMIYRRVAPVHLRRVARNWILRPRPIPPIDADAIKFLQSIYEPDADALERAGISLPDLRQNGRH